MSSLTRHEVIHWFTTPHELREIADEMEKFWTTCMPGQDTTAHSVYGKNEQLLILVDQDKIKSPGWYETKHGVRRKKSSQEPQP
jgi:hypothetical protein